MNSVRSQGAILLCFCFIPNFLMYNPMHARDLHFVDSLTEIVNSETNIQEMREGLLEGDVFVIRGVESKERLDAYRSYLEGVGRGSLPNYRAIEPNVPNFHRMDRWDPRAHVQSCFHSFSFFPWNQDVFNLFERYKEVYHLKNAVSDLPQDSFLGNEPDMGCTARIGFHYYPKGTGGLNRHQDPFDYHQITVPIMIMSEKGVDFQEGGAYVEDASGEKILLDDICQPGDVIYFNAECFHGVDMIDPDETEDWLSFEGRWILLFAVNKIAGNEAIKDSKDLETEEVPVS